jgi:amino acid transporter
MFWNRIFAKKTLAMLDAEAKGENRLKRVLGPVGLTSLGVGAIIGAGIFVITGRVAANDAGPGVLLSFVVAGVACALAAFCYAEFASMAPVAGSAYTYAYATLGEIMAWIIGWDLILEYAMSAATVASVWSNYLNELLEAFGLPKVPEYLCNDPFSNPDAWFNLPAVLILMACTTVLVIGIKESATSNTALVLLKLGVVIFVIAIGVGYVRTANWFDIPAEGRKQTEQILIPKLMTAHVKMEAALLEAAEEWSQEFADAWVDGVTVYPEDAPPRKLVREFPTKPLSPEAKKDEKVAAKEIKAAKAEREEQRQKRLKSLTEQAMATFIVEMAAKYPDLEHWKMMHKRYEPQLPKTEKDKAIVAAILKKAREKAPEEAAKNWGMIGELGINKKLEGIDDGTRNNFMPYGISGVMVGAALVFFAFIGFDSISTHSEEAITPQRDVPIGILASLALCTVLYIAVAGVITGMVPYYDINTKAAIASAFRIQAEQEDSQVLRLAGGLIAAGALAGMTSVLLITFLSQARIFLAMARDGLMPQSIFGAVHEKFKTPHISTMLTGTLMSLVAAFTPSAKLEEMVNIGTLFAFSVVCAAVLILRVKQPAAPRPFRCPLLYFVAPAGVAVNVILMFFLPVDTWLRLVIWLGIGLCIYFAFGYRFSVMRHVEAATTNPVLAEMNPNGPVKKDATVVKD